MKNLTKVLATLVFGASIFILIVIFLAMPGLNDIDAINADAKEKKIQLETLDQQIRAFKRAQADLKQASRREDITNAFVSKEDLVIVVKELEAAATASATKVTLDIKELGPKDKPSNITNKPKGMDEIP